MAALLGDLPPQHGAQEEDVDDLIPHDPEPTTTSALPTYKSAFLQSCLSASVLTFGTFTLKSGRQVRLCLWDHMSAGFLYVIAGVKRATL